MDVTRPVTSRPAPGRHFRLAAWWADRSALARDIIAILIVKAIVLFLLWYAFFRAPAAPGMAMEPERVNAHLVAPTPAPESAHAVH